MKLSKIIIEGFHATSKKVYEFSDFNYLNGPNGAGKSTALQAIQLGLLGYIPGTAKNKTAIFRHSGNHTMAVTLELDNGVMVRRIFSGVGNNITSQVEVRPEGYDIQSLISDIELPVFNFNDFVGLTANKLKDWFINFLPSSDLSIDWKSELSALAPNIDDKTLLYALNLVSELQQDGNTGIDLIRAVNDAFKLTQSFKKSELERVQNTIQSLVFYDDLDTTLSLDEIQSKLSNLEKLKSEYVLNQDRISRNNKIKTELGEFMDCTYENVEDDPRYKDYLKQYTELSEEITHLKSLPTNQEEIYIVFDKISELKANSRFRSTVINSEGVCPLTNMYCESVANLSDEYRALNESDTAEIQKLEAEYTKLQNDMSERNSKILELGNSLDTVNSQNRVLCSRYATKARLESQIVEVGDYSSPDILDSEIQHYRDQLIKLEANNKYSELIDTLTSDKYQLEATVDAYKAWIKLTGVNGLQNRADNVFLEFSDTISKYISTVFGDGCRAKFHLEAKANSFSFGLDRDGVYIPYDLLSSGEKCMYMLSMMIGIVNGSTCPLKIILVDDLFDHLDKSNINKLFESLYSVDGVQMIFAGVNPVETEHSHEFTINI